MMDEAQARLSRTCRRRKEHKAPPVGVREAEGVCVDWHRGLVRWWANVGLRVGQLVGIPENLGIERIREAKRDGCLFIKMWSDTSKTSDHAFYVPFELANSIRTRFPITKYVLDPILYQLGRNSNTEVLTHGFRRGLALSLRVAFAAIGLKAKKQIPNDAVKRIGYLFAWSKGVCFWKYSADYELFLNKAFLTCESVYYYVLGKENYETFCDARSRQGKCVARFSAAIFN